MAYKGIRKTAPHPQCSISGVDHAPPKAGQKAGVHVGGPGKKQEDSSYTCVPASASSSASEGEMGSLAECGFLVRHSEPEQRLSTTSPCKVSSPSKSRKAGRMECVTMKGSTLCVNTYSWLPWILSQCLTWCSTKWNKHSPKGMRSDTENKEGTTPIPAIYTYILWGINWEVLCTAGE